MTEYVTILKTVGVDGGVDGGADGGAAGFLFAAQASQGPIARAINRNSHWFFIKRLLAVRLFTNQ